MNGEDKKLIAEVIKQTLADVNARSPQYVLEAQCMRRNGEVLSLVRETSNKVLEIHADVQHIKRDTGKLQLDVVSHLAMHNGEKTGETNVQMSMKRAAMWVGLVVGGLGTVSGVIFGLVKLVG